MDINMEVVATIKPDELNEIVKEYLEKKGFTVSEIKPIVGTRTAGHQMHEYQETYFSGIEAKVKVQPVERQGCSDQLRQ